MNYAEVCSLPAPTSLCPPPLPIMATIHSEEGKMSPVSLASPVARPTTSGTG